MRCATLIVLIYLITSPSNGQDLLPCSLDVQRQWTWTAEEGLYSAFHDFVTVGNGEILAAGVARDTVVGSWRLIACRFDSAGLLIWQRRYEDLPYMLEARVFSGNGDYLLIGKTWTPRRTLPHSGYGGSHSLCIAQIDDDGQIVWYRLMGTLFDDQIVDARFVNGVWELIWSTDRIGNPPQGINSYIVQVSSLGDSLSCITIKDRYILDANRSLGNLRGIGLRPDAQMPPYESVFMEIAFDGAILGETVVVVDTTYDGRHNVYSSSHWNLLRWDGLLLTLSYMDSKRGKHGEFVSQLVYFGYSLDVLHVIDLQKARFSCNYLIDATVVTGNRVLCSSCDLYSEACTTIYDLDGQKCWEESFGEPYGRPYAVKSIGQYQFAVVGKGWARGNPDKPGYHHDPYGTPIMHQPEMDPSHNFVRAHIEVFSISR